MSLGLASWDGDEEEVAVFVVVVEKMENAVRISASEEALRLFFAARAEGAGRDG